MERFTLNLEKLVKDKASELYLEVCKEIIETNGLQDKAIEMCKKLCDMHIEKENAKRDPLFSLAPTWKVIKNELNEIPKK
jgi:hypothetical protein